MRTIYRNNLAQRGAVSLFVVIFTALLVTTITISFVQLMVRDQRQAMYSDLSGSAYDSATAGVEDAKRALLMQQDCAGDGSERCDIIRTAIAAGECTTLSTIFDNSSNERAIIRHEGDRRLEQAYTCVKITQDTRDYLGMIDQGSGAAMIPLRGTGEFNTITISWALNKEGGDVTLPADGATSNLPQPGEAWPDSYPALLRAQLINTQGSFQLADLNTSADGDGRGSNTLFLYPSRIGLENVPFGLDFRRDAADGAPDLARCREDLGTGAYACSVTIALGSTVPANSDNAFLNLMALYNATDYKIELRMGTDPDPVPFSGVQPEVDSTGRANDLFRRVVSRVELNNSFTYPTAALEVKNDICKNFSVTTDPDDYTNLEACEP